MAAASILMRSPVEDEMSHADVRATLERRLDVLLRRVREIDGDLRRTADRDWAERAIEVENDDVLEGLDEQSRAEADGIRAALRRLEAGTYGQCAKCGQPIPGARLAALPAATTCLACAAVQGAAR